MKQSRSTSFLKSIISTAVGFALSLFLQWLILPYLIGAPVSLNANLTFAAIMTAVSIARGYLLERFFEMMGWRHRLSAFMQAVIAERFRQPEVEGYDAAHDAQHSPRELSRAGAAYLMGQAPHVTMSDIASFNSQPPRGSDLWPWSDGYKPLDLRRDLVRGCAMGIAAGELADANRKKKAAWSRQ